MAGVDLGQGGELEREDMIQPPDGSLPTDDELRADVVERLRSSDVPAGETLRVSAVGSTIILRGQVESIDVLDEILGIIGEVPGVDEVVDEVEVTAL